MTQRIGVGTRRCYRQPVSNA